ncbi:MAG: hypothetical protein WHV67_00320 [Thermoanaerobaculia bacterium]
MKNFAFFTFILFSFVLCFAQEQAPIPEKRAGSKELAKIEVGNLLGFFENYDFEKKILKVKGEDGNDYEIKCYSEEVKVLGKQKGLRFKDLKKGDLIRVFYRKNKEGEDIVTRIIKDPPKQKTETSGTPGN